ncbi:MAG: hypothetical protein CR981_02040 [Proteobacteria bacterium]|nr:MAG: hypothetical protein CR981_02040 [Pseudomonadota bacterium]PIE64887.1 MAG: hypothetical protein CSA26_06020 [Desulfobacterales bacterium]
MADLDLKDLFLTATTIIGKNRMVIWYIGGISICNSGLSLLAEESPFSGFFTTAALILSTIATPVIYGICFELLENRYSSITAIMRNYLPGYFWLLLLMYMPAGFFAAIPMMVLPEQGGQGYFYIILISFALLYLYVIPFYFFRGTYRRALTDGVTFLLTNLTASTPLLLTALLAESAILIFQYMKERHIIITPEILPVFDVVVYILVSFTDLILFMIMILILKNQNQSESRRDVF